MEVGYELCFRFGSTNDRVELLFEHMLLRLQRFDNAAARNSSTVVPKE